MKISVEISLYPLANDYLPPIDSFIKSLYKHTGLEVHTSQLSTMVIGEYEEVMKALHDEIFTSLEKMNQASFVIKLLKGDAKADVAIEGYR